MVARPKPLDGWRLGFSCRSAGYVLEHIGTGVEVRQLDNARWAIFDPDGDRIDRKSPWSVEFKDYSRPVRAMRAADAYHISRFGTHGGRDAYLPGGGK